MSGRPQQGETVSLQTSPPPDLESILPAELVALPQWVAWKYVTNPGSAKPRKVPLSARTGANASSTDPETWGTFGEAFAWCKANDCDGVGFVFSDTDPYCGIDLDKCMTEDGRDPNEFATGLIEQMDSYAELSPSGTGVHIIVKAVLTGRGRKSDKAEIYDKGRFFTVTGLPIGKPRTIVAERQAEVEKLYSDIRPERSVRPLSHVERKLKGPELADDTVIDLIVAASKKGKFSVLFAGNWEQVYGSHSEADLALVGIIADFVGDNQEQIDRLFRRSKLFRPKWDEHRGALTYGEMTIAKVLGDQA